MYSKDCKAVVVKTYLHFKSMRKTASVVGISKSTIQRWVANNPLVKRIRSRRKLTHDIVQRITTLLEENPFTNPAIIAATISREFSTSLSSSGVRFWMKKEGITHKKSTRYVTTPDLEERRGHFATDYMSLYDPERVVSMDESSFYFDMKPSKGYCHKSRRLKISAEPGGRSRWSLCMAVTNQRVVGWKLVKGSFDASMISDFIETLDTEERDVILLDNASIHTSERVKDAAVGRGLTPVYLPPYTPDFQPIEHAFFVVKKAFRSLEHTRMADIPKELRHADVERRVEIAITAVSESTLENQFMVCWRRAAIQEVREGTVLLPVQPAT